MTPIIKPYPACKPSGVEWLGDVPAHWEVRRLKVHTANIINQSGERRQDEIYIALEHVQSWTGKINESGTNVSFVSQVKRFQAGDVLFGKLRPYLAKVTRPGRDGVCVGEFLVLRPRGDNLLPGYLEQLLRTKPIIDTINASTFGTKMPRSDWHFIGNMEQPIPPLPEQAAIVRYLAYTDGRIRLYISVKERLIGLLEKWRQAVIHRAVTRGLDPDVRLKPSGVEWLGDVPAHWEVRRLKVHTTNIINQSGERRQDEIYIALEHVQSWTGKINESGTDVSFVSQVKRFQAGDVLFGKLRPYLAKVTRPGRDGVCVGDFLVLRPRGDNLLPSYLEQLLRTKPIIDTINASTFGAKMPRSDWHFIGNMEQPIPPLPEQTAIVEYLDKATTDIDTAIDRARREIELLREYRTRLIADVVTGKLDVRAAAAGLPDDCSDSGKVSEEARA